MLRLEECGHILQEDVDNAREYRFGEWLVDDDIIDTIEELRAEMVLEFG